VTSVTATVTLSLYKRDIPDPVQAGDPLSYQVIWRVGGNAFANNLVLTDTLPAQVQFVSAPGGTYDPVSHSVTWNLGNHVPGDTGTLALDVRVGSPLPNGLFILNTVRMQDASGATAFTSAGTIVRSDHTLAITKVASAPEVDNGDLITYTIGYNVDGNEPAPNVRISDVLPDFTEYVSSDGTYDPDTNVVTWALGNTDPPASGSVTLVLRVVERVLDGEIIRNTAVIEDDDPGTPADEATAETVVRSPYLAAKVGDMVWHDRNENGTRDAGEPGIGGVTVDLYEDLNSNGTLDAGDTFVGRTTTDVRGHYLFDRVITGDYLVTVSDAAGALAGMTKTSGTVGVNDNSQPDPYALFVPNGGENLTADFGYTTPGAGVRVGDLVWRDDNGNAVYEPAAGEVGLPDVTLLLTRDLNGNGAADIGEPTFGVETTNSLGNYLFTDLPADTYVVDVTDQHRVLTFFLLTTGNDPAAVDVSDGVDDLDVDFGYQPGGVGRIGDNVFFDVNDDGTQQGDEPGLGNVTLHLFDPGPDAACGGGDDVLLASTRTDVSGHYLFLGLPAGDYCVHVDESTLPAPLALGSQFANPYGPVHLADQEQFLDADFGYTVPPGKVVLGDLVWSDANGNGVRDPGEPGLGDVTLAAVNPRADGQCGTADDTVVYTTTTRADGTYLFIVGQGTWCVDVTDENGVLTGLTLTGGTDPYGPTVLAAGEADLNADFGYGPISGAVGDFVWEDDNADGVWQSGEVGIPDITLNLIVAGADGMFNTGDDFIVATTTTDANGGYLFTGLPDGDYQVAVDTTGVLVGWRQSFGAPDTDNNGQHSPFPVTISGGNRVLYADFSFVPPTVPGTVSGTVFIDANDDGVQQGSGEPGLEGVTVCLYTSSDLNSSLACTTTDATGAYAFTNVAPGDYVVKVDENTLPPGLVPGAHFANPSVPFLVPPGGDVTDINFGYLPEPGTVLIGDTVWQDDDGNSVQDASESGIAGVTVNLVDAGADALCGTADDATLATATTDALGRYYFNPAPGTYCADVTDTAGVLIGYKLTGGTDPHGPITLGDRGVYLDADFGYKPTPTIGDTVWLDEDGNGAEDAGEPGIQGVTVDLVDAGGDGLCGTADDTVVDTATTDADGFYLFTDLVPGTYCADVTDTGNVLFSHQLTGGTDPHGPVTLGPSTIYLDADFGYEPVTRIEGTVFHDMEGDGVMGAGDAGVSGVAVCLYNPADLANPITCTTTDANGAYAFVDLPLGTYVVTSETPASLNMAEPSTPTQRTVDGPLGGVTGVDFGFATPALTVQKQLGTALGDIEVGDLVTFTITIENVGGVPFTKVPLADTFDPAVLDFVSASPAPSGQAPAGTLTWDNLASAGSLRHGQTITVEVVFKALARSDATENVATVSGAETQGGHTLPDVEDRVTFSIAEPTAVTMSSILAEFNSGGKVVLTWVTVAEFDNWGFNVYRATIDDPTQAVRLNDTLIPGQGQSVTGATYRFLDTTVQAGVTYWYWIEDVDLHGYTMWHGPAQVTVPDAVEPGPGGSKALFMPLVLGQ